ncbi:Ribosomal RNA small subunit methyltransferase E [Rhodovulum sp. PH10]|uniref:16S rRNA (uracil(1498)-N(3))-methyltransferase n=1 Tax=Rhodovulum sp. PH10 TaxID=1187851 RepID=UPI00027C1E84|nr:16S rRNA (uracil(1498)-N(3))-methyltransferase [Rhodovulum sp. PH10]EJW10979.1 Ribosomal RNA small subunit methyltransferase E [Rhodovulum sp. PH10]
MARYDFREPRLFVEAPLVPGARVALEAPQQHYLEHVLRQKPGDRVLAFNGRDGEWRTVLAEAGKRTLALVAEACTRPQPAPGDLLYLFAPLKRARLDYMVQKAVEMGASGLAPVTTRHTQAERVNGARMRANAIEAAEQCGILTLPDIYEPAPLAAAVGALEADRRLIFCDEDAPVADPLAALAAVRDAVRDSARNEAGPGAGVPLAVPLAVLIGPEGGFSEDERAMLIARPGVIRLALGPRILRADTAAVAALAVVQAVLGDWR